MTNEERVSVNEANGYTLVYSGDGYEIYKGPSEAGGNIYFSDRMGGYEGFFPILDSVIVSKEELIAIAKDAYGLELK